MDKRFPIRLGGSAIAHLRRPRPAGGPHAAWRAWILRLLQFTRRAYPLNKGYGARMASPGFDATNLLDRLMAAAPCERARLLREAGPLEAVFTLLADEIEKLAITRVGMALTAGEMLVTLADQIGTASEWARARRTYAQALAYAGRFREALPYYEDGLYIAKEAGLTLEIAECRLASIHALVHLARYEEALAAGQAAWESFHAAREYLSAARADSSLGGIYQKLNDPQSALRHFDRGSAALRADPAAWARMESNRGLALESLDDFSGAEKAHRAASEVFEAAGMAWACAIVEGNLAVLATRQGKLQPALRHFERARRHLEHDAAPAELARTLVEQADALTILRMLEPAEADYRAALPLLDEHGQMREAAAARGGLGRVLALRGNYEEAEKLLAAAEGEYARLGQSVERAQVELAQSEIRFLQRDPNEARRLALVALEILRDRPLDAAMARYHAARAAWAAGDLEAGLKEVNEAIGSVAQLDIAPLLTDLLHLRGCIRSDMDDESDARKDLRDALELVERVRGSLQAQRFRASFHTNRLAIYEDLAFLAARRDDPGSIALAFSAVERAKSRALLDLTPGASDVTVVNEPAKSDDAEATLAGEYTRLRAELNAAYSRLADERTRPADLVSDTTSPEKIHALERRLESLESRLATTRGVIGFHARTLDLPAIQAVLSDDSVLIEYFAGAEELMGFAVTKRECRVYRRLARTNEVSDRVQRLRFQIGRALRPGVDAAKRAGRMASDARRELESLNEMLLAPMRDAIGSARRMVIVPHGPLHTVPFHALWDGKRYTIEQHEISYGPSAGVLANLRRSHKTREAEVAALVIGAADDRAPTIENEARQVAALLGEAQILVDHEATADHFRIHAPRADLIHLACHGFFSPDHPLASGIRLADRWLSVQEICELELRARLITLAACETGRSVIGAGDELAGLLRGFIAAGAETLVASLWIVHDEISGRMMNAFYNQLGNELASAAIARSLREAQLRIMAETPHPADWASFICVGGI